ncbi:MAG: hypothetical protein K2X72_25140 [Reyranella sp.]|nr:hypothetical protein [Reyranella sp.]
MMSLYRPTLGPACWQELLADPQKQWRMGYSARTLAHCWEDAKGLPPEIAALFNGRATLLLAIPEHKVDLPGGTRPSQTDLFALVRSQDLTIACAVEGKVAEAFGPTMQEWLTDASLWKAERLAHLCKLLGLKQPLPSKLRYQLLHRAASAVIEADRFKTDEAAMIVHSFSKTGEWFEDFAFFSKLFGLTAAPDQLHSFTLPSGKRMHLAWATGHPSYLER